MNASTGTVDYDGRMFADKKKFGGLGVINLKIFNRVLLSKWRWKLYSNASDPWCKLINSIHPTSHWRMKHTHKASSLFWKGLEAVQDTFQLLIRYKVSNGTMIFFWEDSWLHTHSLKDLFPQLYIRALTSNSSVAKMLNGPIDNKSFATYTKTAG